MKTLQPADFPLLLREGQICRAGGAAVYMGPLPDDVAADLVERLNRDAAAQSVCPGETGSDETVMMFVGPSLGQFPPGDND